MGIEWEKWIIAAVVGGLALLMWRGVQDRRASPQWPSVTGRVDSSRVVALNEANDGGHSLNREWQVHLRYSYTVNGQMLHNDRIQALLPRFSNEADALALQRRFPAGAEVPVYYDPGKPSSSVLIPG